VRASTLRQTARPILVNIFARPSSSRRRRRRRVVRSTCAIPTETTAHTCTRVQQKRSANNTRRRTTMITLNYVPPSARVCLLTLFIFILLISSLSRVAFTYDPHGGVVPLRCERNYVTFFGYERTLSRAASLKNDPRNPAESSTFRYFFQLVRSPFERLDCTDINSISPTVSPRINKPFKFLFSYAFRIHVVFFFRIN